MGLELMEGGIKNVSGHEVRTGKVQPFAIFIAAKPLTVSKRPPMQSPIR